MFQNMLPAGCNRLGHSASCFQIVSIFYSLQHGVNEWYFMFSKRWDVLINMMDYPPVTVPTAATSIRVEYTQKAGGTTVPNPALTQHREFSQDELVSAKKLVTWKLICSGCQSTYNPMWLCMNEGRPQVDSKYNNKNVSNNKKQPIWWICSSLCVCPQWNIHQDLERTAPYSPWRRAWGGVSSSSLICGFRIVRIGRRRGLRHRHRGYGSPSDLLKENQS